MPRRPKQLELKMPTWGGKRKRAGRKLAEGNQPTPPHRSREPMTRRAPLHVTMKMARNVYNLRSERSLNVIRRSLRAGAARFGVLVVQISVQGNHMHLLVEADDGHTLSRAMKGLSVRLARGLNRMMGRARGKVFAARYHSRVLRSPTAVRNVVRYLRENHRHHHGPDTAATDSFTSEHRLAGVLPSPTLWMLIRGWQRAGPATSW